MTKPQISSSDRIKLFVGSGLGSGYIHPAPGTWGSLAALVVGMTIIEFVPNTYFPLSLCAVLFILLNQWTSSAVIRHWGKDPGRMVMDEWAGLLLSLSISVEWLRIESALIPAAFYTLHFALFRLFDIIKPLGINRLQNFSGGLGILLDDLAAGIYTSLTIFLLSQII